MFQDEDSVFLEEVRSLSATRDREHSSKTGNGSTLSFSSYIDFLLRPKFRTAVSLTFTKANALSTITIAPQPRPPRPSVDHASSTHNLVPPKISTRHPNIPILSPIANQSKSRQRHLLPGRLDSIPKIAFFTPRGANAQKALTRGFLQHMYWMGAVLIQIC